MQADPDHELVLGAQAGDIAALAELCGKRYADVERFFSNKVVGARGTGVVEGLCQDTFLRALRGLAQFNRNCSFRTWLLAIAKNVWIDFLRAHNEPVQEPATWDDEAQVWEATLIQRIASAELDPAVALEVKERSEVVIAAVTRLPEPCRTAVFKYYFGQYDLADIAHALNLSVNQVKHLLRMGRASLAKWLGPERRDLNSEGRTPEP